MIEFKHKRVVVSCQGDIWVAPFSCPETDDSPHGTEWILLEQGEKGEIGRSNGTPQTRDLSTCQGVLIGFIDPRSCDVFIEAFQEAAEELRRRMKRSE